MKKLLLIGAVAFCLYPCKSWAGPEGRVSADPVYDDGGNKATIIKIAASTIPVLISSTPTNSPYGISVWRMREIVNTSTGLMNILYDNTTQTVFCSTCGITLGTGPISGLGDSYVVPHQGEVWGVWNTVGGVGGAGGSENYWKK